MGMRSMKKMFSFILSFVMVASICFAALPQKVEAAGDSLVFTVSADKEVVKRGDQVTVTIEMSGNKTDGYTLSYRLNYDNTKLEYIDSKLGLVAEGAEVSSATGTNQRVNVVVAKPEVLSNGTLVTVTFKVKDNAPAGKIEFTSEPKVSDEYGVNEVPSTVADNTNLSVEVPTTNISLNKTSTTIAKGEKEKLTATLEPEGASSAITWSSADENVATVSADGTVTAVGAGTTTITATANGHSATCKVTVNVPLKSIEIIGEATTIKAGTPMQLRVNYDPEDTTDDKTVEWSSSDASVATVDQNGLVRAIKDGTATITAKVGNVEDTYQIAVKEVKLESISLDREEITIHRGESDILQVIYNPADTTDDKTVEWKSSNPAQVSVDGNGNVKAVALGGAIITARVGDKEATCKVTVDAPLEKIIPSVDNLELLKNQTANIIYTLDPSDTTDNKAVTFETSNSDVATVSPNGTVKAVGEGEATITLKGANNITATVAVTVTEIPIETVALDRKIAVVEKGDSIDLTATVGPENTTDDNKEITWESSDETIATISSKNTNSGSPVKVTALGSGEVTITATAGNGIQAKCEIIIPVHVDKISLPQMIEINRNDTEVLEITYDPVQHDDTVTNVVWSSMNEDIASVDPESGMITAIKEGSAKITVNVTVTTLGGTTKEYSATTQVSVKENHLVEALGNTVTFEDKEELLKGQKISNMRDRLNLDEILNDYAITDDITIDWTSSDKTVASIDQAGTLTGLKEGTTTVKAVILAKDGNGNTYGPYNVEVEVEVQEIPLDSIAFDKIIKEMQVGAKDVLHVIYNPQNTTDDRDVIWNSSDASVLTVDKNGNLTALKAGKATITATVGEKEISCEIIVKAVDTGKPGQSDGSDSAGNETGAAKGDESGVRTGDPAMIILYVALFVGAMATIVLIRRRNRRVR